MLSSSIVSGKEDLEDQPVAGLKKAAAEKVRVALVGDSTVCDYPPGSDTAGWGQMLSEFLNEEVSFLNAALGGRSSKSFFDEGHWPRVLLFRPDFVFLQFGHNDQPGKGPERETHPETTYREALRRYITDLRGIGACPILVTSVARRRFEGNKVVSNLGPWVDAVKAVAGEEGVAMVDLHGSSIAFYERMGEKDGTFINNGRVDDRTHFSPAGAREIAALVVRELPDLLPELAVFLKSASGPEKTAGPGSRAVEKTDADRSNH